MHTVRYIQNTGELRGTAVYKPDSARPPVLLQLESLKPESPLIDKKIKSTSLIYIPYEMKSLVAFMIVSLLVAGEVWVTAMADCVGLSCCNVRII